MRPLTDEQLRVSFYERLRPEDDCLVWVGAKDGPGYGVVYVGGGRCIKAHRFAWKLAHGSIPDGLHVCHHCDNPPCCRLDHLFIGTHADNMADMSRKGRVGAIRRPERLARGEGCHNILTEAQVREAIASLETAEALAIRFGVTKATITHARNGRNWAHLDVERMTGTERSRRRRALEAGW